MFCNKLCADNQELLNIHLGGEKNKWTCPLILAKEEESQIDNHNKHNNNHYSSDGGGGSGNNSSSSNRGSGSNRGSPPVNEQLDKMKNTFD